MPTLKRWWDGLTSSVFPALGASYIPIPKVACTAILAVLAWATGRPLRALHEAHQIDWRLRAPLAGFTFGFVRNPWDRWISCWLNKLSKKDLDPCIEVAHGPAIRRGMPFADFVHAACQIPDELADPHFKSQAAFLRHPVDFVGRFESLEQDWKQVCDRIGIQLPLPMANASDVREHYSAYYTTELADMVAAREADTIDRFGYRFEQK